MKAPEKWIVYMLLCADGTIYTGVTTDPKRRLEQHNAGTASRYTRARRPVEMMHHESGHTRGGALSREAAIKRLPRAAKLLLVGKNNSGSGKSGKGAR